MYLFSILLVNSFPAMFLPSSWLSRQTVNHWLQVNADLKFWSSLLDQINKIHCLIEGFCLKILFQSYPWVRCQCCWCPLLCRIICKPGQRFCLPQCEPKECFMDHKCQLRKWRQYTHRRVMGTWTLSHATYFYFQSPLEPYLFIPPPFENWVLLYTSNLRLDGSYNTQLMMGIWNFSGNWWTQVKCLLFYRAPKQAWDCFSSGG